MISHAHREYWETTRYLVCYCLLCVCVAEFLEGKLGPCRRGMVYYLEWSG